MDKPRPFIFRAGRMELTLPITPESYRVGKEHNYTTVNLYGLGDVPLAGFSGYQEIVIPCIYPANDYPFARDSNPSRYINQFNRWRDEKTPLRFVIGNTAVNESVRVRSHFYGEQDGSNDVYAEIILIEHVHLPKPKFERGTVQTKARASETQPKQSKYTIQPGDTLSQICWKVYGDAGPATYNKVAALNGIANPHLIFPPPHAKSILTLPQPLP